MPEYIERENLLDGISSPESGFDDTIENLIFEHNLDFLHDNDEDEVRAFAKELIGKVKNYISTEPTADVVEVVRCRDCKFATELDKHCELSRAIYKHCSLLRGEPTDYVWHKYKRYYKNYSLVEADDYCSYGER